MKGRVFLLLYGYLGLLLPASAETFSFAEVDGGKEVRPLSPPTDNSLLKAPYRDKSLPLEKRVDDLLSRLTLEEQAELLHGAGGSSYGNIPRIGLGEFMMYDGPQGVRYGGPATSLPSGISMAATWNPALIRHLGNVIAEECKEKNSRMILGPGLNIMRSPLGGRNFEYFGEDPYLSGKITAGYVSGVQERGVATCLKHWIVNDQEWNRNRLNVEVSERALREIYARPFEITVNEASPWSVMSGNNQVRGSFCSHSRGVNDMLYKDMNWDGAMVSDWGAWINDAAAVNGGCTIEMPSGKNADHDKAIVAALKNGDINKEYFTDAVRRNLRLLFRVGAFDHETSGALNTPDHAGIGRRVAEESLVLLKNEKSFLPLDRDKLKKVAVIGPNADQYQTMADGNALQYRGGSGAVQGPYEVTPLKALVDYLGKERVLYAPGFRFENPRLHSCPDLPEMLPEEAAAQADVVLFFGGTDHTLDRESLWFGGKEQSDKPDLNLKGPQAELLQKVLKVNPRTAVILVNGSPVQMEEWCDRVPAILEAWYGGQDAGTVMADVLFGKVNPSGKLPCTFGRRLTDWLCHSLGAQSYPGVERNGLTQQEYADHIWVGYRHFDKAKIEPRFPFGHGLSYTSFRLEKAKEETGKEPGLSVRVTNAGDRAGAEVVQFYLSKPEDTVEMPEKELVHFEKVFLNPGESKVVSFAPGQEACRFWDESSKAWMVAPGVYTLRAGSSSRDLPVSSTFTKE